MRNEMKLNKENYELMMFDLLEGNLSESEELVLMKQIEEDEFFFREWKLFKSTVLVADNEVVYAQKDSLMKEETVVFPIRRVWMSIAASICLLAAAYVFWPNTSIDQPLALDRKIESPVIVDSTARPSVPVIEEATIIPVIEPEKFVAKTHSPSVENVTPIIKETPQTENELIENENLDMEQKTDHIAIDEARKKIDQKLLEEYESKQKDQQLIAQKDPEPIKEEIIVPKIEKIEAPKEIIAEVGTEDDSNEKRKISEFVTNNPAKRIKEKATEIIALVSNPKVKIKPSFNNSRPSLNIELETSGYSAVASLQPFKNKNNN